MSQIGCLDVNTQKWPQQSHMNEMQMLYISRVFHSWKHLAGHKSSLRWEEWSERMELFNDTSFPWGATGWCSLTTYARQTDRQFDSYEDRWTMQCLQHWGKWDQMLTVRWTDLWSGLQMFSHIFYHMVCERVVFPDERRTLTLPSVKSPPPCMLCNLTEFNIICTIQQVAQDKRFTSINIVSCVSCRAEKMQHREHRASIYKRSSLRET